MSGGTVPDPASHSEALAMALASLRWLADSDLAAAPVSVQADCLRDLEHVLAAHAAARSRTLAAFCASGGYEDDGHGSPRTWLSWQTRVTAPAASAAVGWTRRLAAHPAVADALRDGEISLSWARQVCDWTDLLPAEHRNACDAILLTAAAGGADLRGLAALAEEMLRRLAPADSDPDGFNDRSLRLETTIGGAGKLWGDLTPQCAAALRTVLDSLSKKAGPEDTRTLPQREHDAMEEMCRRLAGAGFLPDRAGQPLRIQLSMTLKDLTDGLRSDGDPLPAWRLTDDRDANDSSNAADPALSPMVGPGYDCDASIAPIVTGRIDQDLLDRLAALIGRSGQDGMTARLWGSGLCLTCLRSNGAWATGPDSQAAPRQHLIAAALNLLSGPAGLASVLRTGTLAGPAASVSLPLDMGTPTEVVPPHLRRALIARDKHCAYPGCDQPAPACHAHHIKPRREGGLTKLPNLLLLCSFHHLILVHRWGWRIALNPDGTTTATSPDGRVFRSHGPPGATAA